MPLLLGEETIVTTGARFGRTGGNIAPPAMVPALGRPIPTGVFNRSSGLDSVRGAELRFNANGDGVAGVVSGAAARAVGGGGVDDSGEAPLLGREANGTRAAGSGVVAAAAIDGMELVAADAIAVAGVEVVAIGGGGVTNGLGGGAVVLRGGSSGTLPPEGAPIGIAGAGGNDEAGGNGCDSSGSELAKGWPVLGLELTVLALNLVPVVVATFGIVVATPGVVVATPGVVVATPGGGGGVAATSGGGANGGMAKCPRWGAPVPGNDVGAEANGGSAVNGGGMPPDGLDVGIRVLVRIR
jgi:hypothetical protein